MDLEKCPYLSITVFLHACPIRYMKNANIHNWIYYKLSRSHYLSITIGTCPCMFREYIKKWKYSSLYGVHSQGKVRSHLSLFVLSSSSWTTASIYHWISCELLRKGPYLSNTICNYPCMSHEVYEQKKNIHNGIYPKFSGKKSVFVSLILHVYACSISYMHKRKYSSSNLS